MSGSSIRGTESVAQVPAASEVSAATAIGMLDPHYSHSSSVVFKDLLDARLEQTGKPKRERQTRVELSLFDGVDGLPGYVHSLGEPGLRPVAFGTQDLQTVFHFSLRMPSQTAMQNTSEISAIR